jgi:hypothetical protein
MVRYVSRKAGQLHCPSCQILDRARFLPAASIIESLSRYRHEIRRRNTTGHAFNNSHGSLKSLTMCPAYLLQQMASRATLATATCPTRDWSDAGSTAYLTL